MREIRATNQEQRYLEGLNRKIDEHEKIMIRGELGTGVFVNAASVIMRLGVATTILVGANLILSGAQAGTLCVLRAHVQPLLQFNLSG